MRTYRLFKLDLLSEKYLTLLPHLSSILAKFRLSCHSLAIQTGRYTRPPLPPEGRGEFNKPYDGHCIVVYETSGKFVTSFGRHGKNEGEFIGPFCITSCVDGFIHVCDFRNNRVEIPFYTVTIFPPPISPLLHTLYCIKTHTHTHTHTHCNLFLYYKDTSINRTLSSLPLFPITTTTIISRCTNCRSPRLQ